MILVALDKCFGPVNVGQTPDFLVSDYGVGAHRAVALLVGLVHHVHSVFVAELVPARVVGVMAGAYKVYVGLFHQFQVLAHYGFGEGAAGAGVVLVAVHAFELDHLAIHFEEFAVYFYCPESSCVTEAFRTVQGNFHRIQVRILCRPKLGPVYVEGKGDGLLPAAVQLCGECLCLVVERYFESGLAGLAASVVKADFHIKMPLCEAFVQAGLEEIVPDEDIRPGPQPHAAEYAAAAPHILVFQIAAVGPAIYFHRQFVGAGAQVFGNVEFCRGHRVLAIAHLLPVYPYIHCGLDAAEFQEIMG